MAGVVDLSNIGLEGQQAFYTRMATAAQAENLQANAAKDQFELQQAQKMQALSDTAAQMLSDTINRKPNDGSNLLGDVDPDNSADVLDKAGKLFMLGGAPKMGADLMKNASEIRNQQSEIEKRTADMEKDRLERIQKGAQIVGVKLGKARNQAEWDQGMKEVEAAGLIEPDLMGKLKGMPYDPDVAAYFYDQSINAADQARLDLEKHTAERLDRQQSIANEQRERTLSVQQAREREQKRHNLVQEKNGGSHNASVPQKELVKSASLVLQQGVFKDVDPSSIDLKAATDYIASQAQQLLRDNKALDRNTAIQQAVIQAKSSGAFSTTPGDSGWFGTGFHATPKSVKFSADGLHKETAKPLPPGIKSIDQAKKQLVVGQWYNTTRGPAKWTGSAWAQ